MNLLNGEHKVDIPFRSTHMKGALNDTGSEIAVLIVNLWDCIFTINYQGKNMNNKVIKSLTQFFISKKLTTLRFRYPRSCYSPKEKVSCVIEASNYLLGKKGRISNRKILLVCYSYGSLIGGSASVDVSECIGIVHVACPVSIQSSALLCFSSGYHLNRFCFRKDIPRLFVHGMNDCITPVTFLLKYIRENFFNSNQQCDVTVKILEGYSHIFSVYCGSEKNAMTKAIDEWISEQDLL